jgi:hypothetical protein
VQEWKQEMIARSAGNTRARQRQSAHRGERAVPGAITAFYTGASIGINIFGKIDGLK